MRLIDADALAEQVDNLCADWNENWIGNDNQSFILHGDVSDIISDAPTIEAEPVRHGRWIEDGDCVICSECGEEHSWIDYRASFCEDCGAKMDVKEADHETAG